MMNCLINQLDFALKDCKSADSYSYRRTAFDHAFGMLMMFCALYPNVARPAEKLWEEVYRPQFEDLVYGLPVKTVAKSETNWRPNSGNAFI